MRIMLQTFIIISAALFIVPASIDAGNTKSVKISFFYDANLNSRQDRGEPLIHGLTISASGDYTPAGDSALLVPAGKSVMITVSGTSPCGKALVNATFLEPEAVVMLPRFTFTAGSNDAAIGLSDGYLTSPVSPRRVNIDDYNTALHDPEAWKSRAKPFYPAGWQYAPNYFFYGYSIPEGGLKGTPHLAFDIWAVPGTPVLAAVPGIITEPLFDWKFGITGAYGSVYYNHIIPAVKKGDRVRRYDVVGYIAEGQGNHLHFEIRPEAAFILDAFPGVRSSYFMKSPLNGESVPLPPFFGPE